MADIRINALVNTASSTVADDYLAVDGSASGTRKLSAYSPTFGGNLTVNGTASAGTLTDGYITIAAAEIKRLSNFVEIQGSGSGGVRMFGATATPITFSSAGNLTVGGTGWNTFAGSIATTGANSLLQASTSIIDHSAGTFRAIGYGANTSTAAGFSFIGLSSNGTVGGTRFSIDSSGNSTFAGNLTVNGTGNNTFNSGGGNLGIGITPTLAKLEVRTATATTGAKTNIAFLGSSNAGGLLISHSNAGSRFHTDLTSTIFGSSGNDLDLNVNDGVGGMTIKYQGNVLFGTTTDSSNGKIQLATHTTSAGGIGFGTDTSLYRSAAGAVTVSSDGVSFTTFTPSGTPQQQIYRSGADAQFRLTRGGVRDWDLVGGSTFQIKGDGTTALTLDASQNATFAGNVLLAASKGIALNGQTNPAVHGISASGNNLSVAANTGGVVNLGTASNGSLFTVDGNGVIKTQGGSAITPANAFATGTAGMIQWDASYIYVCTAANTWKRAAIAAW